MPRYTSWTLGSAWISAPGLPGGDPAVEHVHLAQAGVGELLLGLAGTPARFAHQHHRAGGRSGELGAVLQTPQRLGPVAVGRVSAEAGQAAADCVVWAAQAALRKEIGAIVTAPLHKEALAAAGISYPGHTELLQAQAAAFLGKSVSEVPVRMMLANDELRTVLLSIHVALRDAIDEFG